MKKKALLVIMAMMIVITATLSTAFAASPTGSTAKTFLTVTYDESKAQAKLVTGKELKNLNSLLVNDKLYLEMSNTNYNSNIMKFISLGERQFRAVVVKNTVYPELILIESRSRESSSVKMFNLKEDRISVDGGIIYNTFNKDQSPILVVEGNNYYVSLEAFSQLFGYKYSKLPESNTITLN